jgi:hypothetical protein
MRRNLKPKESPLIKPFDKNEAITRYRFSQICGCSLPAISKAVDAQRLFLNADETITPGHIVNQIFMQKQLIKNIIKGSPEEAAYRQKVLASLLGDIPITESGDTPEPKPYNYKNLKEDIIYNIGVMDESIFIPLITLFKSEDKSVEISVLKNNISIGMQKGIITDIFINEQNVGELFFTPAN